MCVTRGVVLLCCGLVLSPRGLSSFTEPWQKMEAGRGVCCIKKPLPCSDLSPLPHTLTRTQTHTPIHLTTPRHLTLLQLDSTLYQTQTYSIDTHARMHTHTHTPTHTEPHTPSNTHLFHHKMAASEKECEGARCCTMPPWWFCILMVFLLFLLHPSFPSAVLKADRRAAGIWL